MDIRKFSKVSMMKMQTYMFQDLAQALSRVPPRTSPRGFAPSQVGGQGRAEVLPTMLGRVHRHTWPYSSPSESGGASAVGSLRRVLRQGIFWWATVIVVKPLQSEPTGSGVSRLLRRHFIGSIQASCSIEKRGKYETAPIQR